MGNTVEVQIPQGYEYKKMATPILTDGGGMLQVMLTKKNIKNFDFYVDEYLRSDCNTTNDMLCNWWDRDTLEVIGNNLKQNKLQFVPWEVKIGLLKFICKDLGYNKNIVLYHFFADHKDFTFLSHLKQICPFEFLNSILK